MRRLLALAALVAVLAVPALGRTLPWNRLPVGYRFSTEDLLDTIGHGYVRSGAANETRGALLLPRMAATVTRLDAPPRLLLSNAPEALTDVTLPGMRAILVAAELPPGETRILASHANQKSRALDLVLRIENAGEGPAEVVLDPRAASRQNPIPGDFRVDALVGGDLAARFLKDLVAERERPAPWRPADGDRKRILPWRGGSQAVLVSSFRGLGTCMATLRTTEPLRVWIHAVPSGRAAVAGDPVMSRVGSQARGVFAQPDCGVELTVDLDAGPTCWPIGEAERDNPLGVLDGGSWMTGVDPTSKPAESLVNRGDFGGISWLRLTARGRADSSWRDALILLVAGGRKAAVIPRIGDAAVILPQWSGMVVGRVSRDGTWSLPFTLPPNSWAPVYLVAVPIRG